MGGGSKSVSPADEQTTKLHVKCMVATDVHGGSGDFVGRRGFSCICLLASREPLELESELFPLFQ